MNGVLVMDKEKDFTSFDTVAVMRGIAREKKIGHTGTLDPMATGVLPLLLGRAAKAADLLPDTSKSYIAGFRIGEKTDTGDITGQVTETSPNKPSMAVLRTTAAQFTGEIQQTPPMYSAVSVGGQRLYSLARQGITVERDSRPVHIESLDIVSYDEKSGEGVMSVSCGKGTYIRTLIEDIAQAAGSCGVMTELRRTAACGFMEADAITLAQAQAFADAGMLSDKLMPVDKLFTEYKAVSVSEAQAKRFVNGGGLMLSRLKALGASPIDGERFRVYSPENLFLGLGNADLGKEELRVLKLFELA
jgi:tRNA pseudouridine 55 synthase